MKKIDIEQIISRMTLEQKVGQCLVIGFCGTIPTPKIYERIKKYTPGGIRVSTVVRTKDALADPYAYNQERLDAVLREAEDSVKDFTRGGIPPKVTNGEYCAFLNSLKQAALDNGLGVPVHITLDMEGGAGGCYVMGDMKYFPNAMGLASSGDPELAYKAGWAVARQLSQVGFSWIHSPVLDVNSNPQNPEIGMRSFGETAEAAGEYALQSFLGLRDGGLIATGKHFPGRGASDSDAHSSLPEINLSRDEMQEHLQTFRKLIDAGIPAIMTAHTKYPQLDPSGLPATLSKTILTDLLKGEMGFQGAVTTDDITMGGIVEKFEVYEACIMALNAGADLILFRDESSLIDDVFPRLVAAARNGLIPEERLNDAVRRTLRVKCQYGLFEDGGIKDPEKAGSGIQDPKVQEIEQEVSEKTVRILRDEQGILPLDINKSILLVEQIDPLQEKVNTKRMHPCMLWEKMLEYDSHVGIVETQMKFDAYDQERVWKRIEKADIVVITNYNVRRSAGGNEFVRKVAACGKPVVVVTNSHYHGSLDDGYKTIVLNYSSDPVAFGEVARRLFRAD